ncbi:MAG: helix-turn-helix transcriptional regulator, partial [Brotaphodocola sp.]
SSSKTLLANYYHQLPVVKTSVIRYLACVVGQYYYGTNTHFTMTEIFHRSKLQKLSNPFLNVPDVDMNFSYLEQRTSLEHQLFLEICSGNKKQALHTYDHLYKKVLASAPAVSSNLELTKSYSYSLNVLCRHAAYKAGVPPTVLHISTAHHHDAICRTESISQLHELDSKIISQSVDLIQTLFLSHYGTYAQKVIEYIFTHLNCEITLSELAEHVQLAPTYLSAVFKDETGRSVMEFVIEKKMTYARLLLKNTSVSIQEIAQHLGYRDVSYFSRVFRKKTGMTPSSYRSKSNVESDSL